MSEHCQPASSSPSLPQRRGGRVLVAALICQLAVYVVVSRRVVTRAGAESCLCGGEAQRRRLVCYALLYHVRSSRQRRDKAETYLKAAAVHRAFAAVCVGIVGVVCGRG